VSYWRYGQMVSLSNACKFFSVPVKDGVDGSMVYPLYKEGKIDEIAAYCRQDVEATRSLFKILSL